MILKELLCKEEKGLAKGTARESRSEDWGHREYIIQVKNSSILCYVDVFMELGFMEPFCD